MNGSDIPTIPPLTNTKIGSLNLAGIVCGCHCIMLERQASRCESFFERVKALLPGDAAILRLKSFSFFPLKHDQG